MCERVVEYEIDVNVEWREKKARVFVASEDRGGARLGITLARGRIDQSAARIRDVP